MSNFVALTDPFGFAAVDRVLIGKRSFLGALERLVEGACDCSIRCNQDAETFLKTWPRMLNQSVTI